MIISFFSNFLNHHQAIVADELYRLTDKNFYFIELVRMPDSFRNMGYEDLSFKPYLIQAWKDRDLLNKAIALCLDSDVALFGGQEALSYQVMRAKNGKMSFEVSERWFKRGFLNLLSPRLLKNMWYYHTLFRLKPIYKLCSSAYGARDQYILQSYKNRCFKWGYFTRVDDIEEQLVNEEVSSSKVMSRIMWCARFIKCKHPEMPIRLAQRLKKKGFQFVVDMFGSGEELKKVKDLAKSLDVEDVVRFCGNRPNADILEEMRRHDIFLFTSDENEGWGAVVNEAMANGCAVVGSNAVGCVPYLINDRVNGCIFQSENLSSLESAVEFLLNHPKEQKKIAYNGYMTMKNDWSPEKAARNLLILIDDLISGRESSITSGPCSKALPL